MNTFLLIQSLRIVQENSAPRTSNHSLFLIKLTVGHSYPEGSFGGNQLLDGLMGLSPLYPILMIGLHVIIDTGFHQSIPWLTPIQS